MIVTYRRCLSIFALERGEFWSPWSACVESTISRWGMRAPNYESHFHLNATKERANLPMHCAFWSNKDIVSSLNLVHVWKLYITHSFLFLDKCHWDPYVVRIGAKAKSDSYLRDLKNDWGPSLHPSFHHKTEIVNLSWILQVFQSHILGGIIFFPFLFLLPISAKYLHRSIDLITCFEIWLRRKVATEYRFTANQ